MDPLMRKLFQPREAREKLRGMGGIMSSSPQLASTVAKFQQGDPIQSRSLGMPSAPDAPMPSAGRARATRIGDRTFVLTDDGRVLDAQTGAPAPQEVAAEVMRRLSPQLSMADIVGAAPDFTGGVNPSFREDTSGQLPPMPSDLAPMSEPAMPADPGAPFDMAAFQRDLTGAGRAIAGPGLMAIDELSYDGPFFAPANDTSAAEAAVDRRMNADAVIDAPTVARTAPQSVSDVTRALEEFYPGSGYADVMRGGPRMPPDLSDKAGSGFPNLMDSLGNAAQLGTMLFPGARLPASEIIEAAPEIQDRVQGAGPGFLADIRDTATILSPFATDEEKAAAADTINETGIVPRLADPATADTQPVVETPVAGTTSPAPTLDVDLDDPDTYDTNFDEMMRRLGEATGKEDKSSRQKAMADLAMIGLAIAAGQSPDALTNIAQGALTGVKAIRAEDAATSAADRETRLLAARMASEATNLDREIASRERIARMNLEGRGDSYAKLLLEQTNALIAAGEDAANALSLAKLQLKELGLEPTATAAPIQMTAEERNDEIRRRIKVAQDAGDTKGVQALRDSIVRQKLSPSDFGL